MELFGNPIPVKTDYCSLNNKPQGKVEPYINLYVRITDYCPCNCSFCSFHSLIPEEKPFDIYKFLYVILNIRKNIRINKISFTGGEPTTNSDVLCKLLKEVKNIDNRIFTVVNTNGMNLDSLDNSIDYIDSICLSRHHWSDEENLNIYKNNVIDYDHLMTYQHKNKIHLSCNLIKDYVDCPEKIYQYINEHAKIGYIDYGFVCLMQNNEYSKKHFVPFFDDAIPNTIKTKSFSKENDCNCMNLLTYTDNGSLCTSYIRNYANSLNCDSVLVYDKNKLKIGFTGKTIFD